jgi:hypothetical protein
LIIRASQCHAKQNGFHGDENGYGRNGSGRAADLAMESASDPILTESYQYHLPCIVESS